MQIDTVITQLEERKKEIDITIRLLRQELAGTVSRSSSPSRTHYVRKRAPMSAARKRALSMKLKKIWAARKAKAA